MSAEPAALYIQSFWPTREGVCEPVRSWILCGCAVERSGHLVPVTASRALRLCSHRQTGSRSAVAACAVVCGGVAPSWRDCQTALTAPRAAPERPCNADQLNMTRYTGHLRLAICPAARWSATVPSEPATLRAPSGCRCSRAGAARMQTIPNAANRRRPSDSRPWQCCTDTAAHRDCCAASSRCRSTG